MNMIQKIKLLLFGAKPKSSSDDLKPRGILHSIVPKEYNDKVAWDSEKFPNQKIIG